MSLLTVTLKRGLPVLSLLLLFVFLLQASACKRMDDDMGLPQPDPDPDPTEALCDSTRTPIVFVHGFLASGDTYASQVQRFVSNRYCPDWLYAFDWNTLGNQDLARTRLDQYIDQVLAYTGAEQVHLVGHSAGGGLGYNYLSDATRAAKVSRYVHVGSGAQSQPAGPNGEVPTANLYSDADAVVAGADIPGAENERFTNLDHYEIATGAGPFEAMYRFFNEGEAPMSTEITPEAMVQLAGRVVALGANDPLNMARVRIYEVDPETGRPLRDTPDADLLTNADGHWGPWEGEAGIPYMFHVVSANPSDRPLFYFREGFVRSNPLVYLRTFPPPGNLINLLFAGIPSDDNQTVLAIFAANQSVLSGRDALTVDGFDLATSQYANASRTTIAYFLYDGGDGQTSGNIHATFNFFPTFLVGLDYYIPTEPEASVRLEFNGRSLVVPNLKSGSEGVVIAVFD